MKPITSIVQAAGSPGRGASSTPIQRSMHRSQSVAPPPSSGLLEPKPRGETRKASVRGPIRLLVVDDHPVVRKGLCCCLRKQARLQVIGEAADGEEALSKVAQLAPDIVLMDIDMPRMNGLAATEALSREHPHIKVLILSMHGNSEYVLRIIQAGARGYVLKGNAIEEVLKAVESVHAGETFFSPDVARLALNRFVRGNGQESACELITSRERQVLIAIAEGYSNKEIASRLGVGVRTIETHRERIMRKLNIHTIAGLTRYAITKGFVPLPQGATQDLNPLGAATSVALAPL